MHYEYINALGKLQNRKVLGEDVDGEILRVENELYNRSKPIVYGGEKGLLISIEKDYESTCVVLQKNGIPYPKQSTVLEFYSASKLIETQNSSNNGKLKTNKKHK